MSINSSEKTKQRQTGNGDKNWCLKAATNDYFSVKFLIIKMRYCRCVMSNIMYY
jgi:hypothetical protein